MATRGGTAAKAIQAKRTLVQLLFGGSNMLSRHVVQSQPIAAAAAATAASNNNSAGSCSKSYKSVDPAEYTHSDLRRAYLEKLKELHPDLNRSSNTTSTNNLTMSPDKTTTGTTETMATNTISTGATDYSNNNNNNNMDNGMSKKQRQEFQLLQDAWMNYEEMAKRMKKVNNGTAEANFTLFGVGCSFSDNDHERDTRANIMDQACRGWFSAGSLPEQTTSSASTSSSSSSTASSSSHEHRTASSLLTMDEFQSNSNNNSNKSSSVSSNEADTTTPISTAPDTDRASKSLIKHLLSPYLRERQRSYHTKVTE